MDIRLRDVPVPHQGLYSALVFTSDRVNVAVQAMHPCGGFVAPHNHVDEGLVEIIHTVPDSKYKGIEDRAIGRDVYVVKPSVKGGEHGSYDKSRGEWLSIKVPEAEYRKSQVAALGTVHYLKSGAVCVASTPTFVLNALGEPHAFLVLPVVGDPQDPYSFDEVYESEMKQERGNRYLGILQ